MREIKFRAWCKSENMIAIDVHKEYDMISGVKFSDGTSPPETCFNSYLDENYYVAEQFTGLKDKNGVEIYEGDIITGNLYDRRLPTMGAVVFDEEHAVFANKNDAGFTMLFRIADIEVIGNVHENQELLK